jgi:ferredoxin
MFHAPNTFDFDDEMKAVVLDERDRDEQVRAAVEGCPTRALIITNANT